MRPERIEQLRLLEELKGTSCLCGGTKQPRSSVCFGCWGKLPRKIQRGLYQRIGQGYEEAYAAAKNHLESAKS